MSNSFFFLRGGDGALSVKELHVNLWLLGYRDSLLEVGARFEVAESVFRAGPLEFDCLTPYPIKNSTVDSLFDQLIKQEYSNLLLDAYNELHRAQGGRVYAVELPGGNYFVLPVKISPISANEIKLCVNGQDVPSEFLSRWGPKEGNGTAKVPFYVRFRYRIDVGKTCATVVRSKRSIHRRLIFDFRANETRSLEDRAVSSIVPIHQVLFFLIQATSYRVELDGKPSGRRYVRILEPGWLPYIQYRGKERFMVYSWRLEGNSSYHLLLGSEREKPDYQPILIGAIIFLFSIVVVWVNADAIKTWVDAYSRWLFLAISGGVFSWAVVLWLLEHTIWQTFFHKRWERLLHAIVRLWNAR